VLLVRLSYGFREQLLELPADQLGLAFEFSQELPLLVFDLASAKSMRRPQ
jgi:hypothetical protein